MTDIKSDEHKNGSILQMVNNFPEKVLYLIAQKKVKHTTNFTSAKFKKKRFVQAV